jgi:hypothetical protein
MVDALRAVIEWVPGRIDGLWFLNGNILHLAFGF